MSRKSAIVIGGGIGGLAAAVALAQRGFSITLLEQAEAFSEVGAGIQISPNGLVVLRALGLQGQLEATGAVRALAVVLRDHAKGAPVARLDLERLRPSQRYFFVHRADLIRVLVAAARRANVTLETGVKVASVRPGEVPQVQMADGTTRRAGLVVAADGVHSVARPVLNGAEKPAFTGQVAWRALVRNEVDHPAEAHVHMGPGRHLVSYPVRDGAMVNLVAVEERSDWAPEGWNHRDDPRNLQDAFAGFGGMAGDLLGRVEEASLWGLHLHPVAARWVDGNVALLGDAAHPTLPFLAQGANMALEDAWALAQALSAPGAKGLQEYQTRRKKRVSRVIRASAGNAWRYHLRPGPVRSAAHVALRLTSRFAPGRLVSAYDWLYGYDVTAAP